MGAEPSNTKEARDRTSVSRSYYAAFHEAESLAKDLKAPSPKKTDQGAHSQLFDRLLQASHPLPDAEKGLLRSALSKLRTLRDWRTDADYRLNMSFDPLRPIQALDLSESAGRQLAKSRPESDAAAQ